MEAVSVWPWAAVPEIDGAAVFTGGAVTTAVGSEVADAAGLMLLLAVTVTSSVKPASEARAW